MTRTDRPRGGPGITAERVADLANQNLLCFCHSVSVSEVVQAIRHGASTVAEIQAETLASTGCGGCECEILDLIEKHANRLR